MKHALRTLASATATVIAVAALTVTAPADAAQHSHGAKAAHGTAAHRWQGYATAGRGHGAAKPWLGGYAVGDLVGYRAEPGKAVAKRYSTAPTITDHVPGATVEASREAAWILSAYGSFQGAPAQSAAVDVAVADLLGGHHWRLHGRTQRTRIAASRHGGDVRAYVSGLLQEARDNGSPWHITANGTSAVSGQQATVLIGATNAQGAALPSGLPVTLTYAGHSYSGVTDARGLATFTVTTVTGAASAHAAIGEVTDWRLLLLHPEHGHGSDLALAGVHTTLTSSLTISGFVGQQVSVAPPTLTRTGRATGGTYTVTGGANTRTVTFALYGGKRSASGLTCSGTPVYRSSATISSAGTRPLPAYAIRRSGYYRWEATVSGNSATPAVSACGRTMTDQSATSLSERQRATKEGLPKVALKEAFGIDVAAAGFDGTEAGHTLTAELHGPFATRADAGCAKKLVQSVRASVDGSGAVALPSVRVGGQTNVGWYAWKTTLSGGSLILGSTSACGAAFHVVK